MSFARIAFVALLLLSAGQAAAQSGYPDRTIRIIVGFTPGSATDISGRMFAQKLSEAWSVPVTVENIPGGGGSVGGERVSKAAPDGYTLYWGANGAMTINPSLQPNPAFDPQRDLAPIARLLVSPSILAVNNDVPAKTVAELIALAKTQPGKLSFASPGAGTPQHIAGEVFKRQLGLDIVHVPYRGAVFTDVIGGRVTMTFQNAGAILPSVREGKLRGLAMTARTRSPSMPDLPTMIEAGVPDCESVLWFGIEAPAGTPQPIVDKLNRAANEAIKSDDVAKSLHNQTVAVHGGTPADFARHIEAERKRWNAVVEAAGLRK